MYENLLYEVKDGIAFITVNRPDAMNALNRQVLDELYEAFTAVNEDPEVRVAIITGEGRAFVAGADIAEMVDLGAQDGRAMMLKGQRVMNFIEDIDKPVIAAVNGFALGGGCELAMACDIRIGSENSKFGQPEVGLGITPGFGGTQRLPRLVGKGMAKYLILTAEMIDAQEAYRIGLIDKIVVTEELMGTAEKVAKTIISKAPIAVRAAKLAINKGINLDVHSGVAFEGEAVVSCFASEDQTEGMRAFLEKRPAKFQNK